MLKAIIDFFKNFFSFLKPSPPPPAPKTNLPTADSEDPQDGAEVTQDSAVVVVNEEEPIIEESTPDPFEDPGELIEPEEETSPAESTSTGGGDPVTEASGTETEPEEVEPEPEEIKPKGKYLWCLDNGHGNKTRGKRSPVLSNGKRFFEYEFNRDIVRRIIEGLEDKEISYFNVVPEVDTDNFLEGRVARANLKESELPKIFVSIHSNAGPAPTLNDFSMASGIETWYYHGSSKGRKIASIFQKELMKRLNWKNRNIRSKAKKQFYVLRNTTMPAVLTENGFYNNKREVELLIKDEIRQKIADAHIAAIIKIEKEGL